MTQTLRRQLIQTIKPIIDSWNCHDEDGIMVEEIADSVIKLRAFSNLKPAKMSIDWLAAGVEVTQDQIDKENLEEEALNRFETDMGCPKNWSWYPSRTSEEAVWRQLREFVIEKYKENPTCFQAYQTWRTNPFARGAMSNVGIINYPEKFQASWSDFLSQNQQYIKKETKFQSRNLNG